MGKPRNTYTNEFKAKVVLESLQRDTTIEKVKHRYSFYTQHRLGEKDLHAGRIGGRDVGTCTTGSN